MPRYKEEDKKRYVREIKKLYVTEEKSIAEIARITGFSEYSVRHWLVEEGVQMRKPHRPNKIDYDPEELRKLADEGLSMDQIGKQMHASAPTIREWMKEQDIEINLEARKRREQKNRETKQRTVKKCRTCRFRSDKQNANGCDYAWLTGKIRGCPIAGCTRYEKGNRIKRKGERFRLAAG